nr:uncharacterized protein LOC113399895 isoform X1 [Vanessa tameamea]XP_026494947.1 uncharacterized protein LOC113399895 isoform X1 [Vanessa tameamea]XP_026494948.1 uncharacterized protein LOC113399895 isoform X1 [Vanessa tameamea]
MSDISDSTMNLKLNNEVRSSVNLLHKAPSTVKEERRRTGRYIAILVGICLFLLALYHAWVRRIPVVASLVVPALIMFVYVGWVLYTASRDKKRLLAAAEAALNAAMPTTGEADDHTSELSHSNIEISVIPNRDMKVNSPEDAPKDWSEISSVFQKGDTKHEDKNVRFVKPIILINDKLPEDLDQKWTNIVETLTNSDRLKGFQTRRKFKRKFCRKKRHATFKRSYSIG